MRFACTEKCCCGVIGGDFRYCHLADSLCCWLHRRSVGTYACRWIAQYLKMITDFDADPFADVECHRVARNFRDESLNGKLQDGDFICKQIQLRCDQANRLAGCISQQAVD